MSSFVTAGLHCSVTWPRAAGDSPGEQPRHLVGSDSRPACWKTLSLDAPWASGQGWSRAGLGCPCTWEAALRIKQASVAEHFLPSTNLWRERLVSKQMSTVAGVAHQSREPHRGLQRDSQEVAKRRLIK